MKRIALWCIAALVTAGAGVFVLGKFYEIQATRQHPLLVYRALAFVRDVLVAAHSSTVELPDGFAPAADPAGAALYRRYCVDCHGGPGVAPRAFALGMMPVPTNLVEAARRRDPEQIQWIIRHGLKMTGMPAWELRLSDSDIWRVTAFVEALPALAPVDFVALVDEASNKSEVGTPTEGVSPPDPEQGRLAMQLYGCSSCHIVPGVVGARVRVGPSLEQAGIRRYIAGVLPNTPENMARWIIDPQAVDPLSAMPDLGVPPGLARDMAAYLYATAPARRNSPEIAAD